MLSTTIFLLGNLPHLCFLLASELASPLLWNKNVTLAKEAAKFLGEQEGEAAAVAFRALQSALELEDQPTLEIVIRPIAKHQAEHPTWELEKEACDRVAELVDEAPERFKNLAAKLKLSS